SCLLGYSLVESERACLGSKTGHSGGDALRHVVQHFAHGLLDSVEETLHAGVAVALDDNALQAQQARTVVSGRIDLVVEVAQQWRREPRTQATKPVSAGTLLHHILDDADHAGTALDHDIAREAVT